MIILFVLFILAAGLIPIVAIYIVLGYIGRSYFDQNYTPGKLSGWIICGIWFWFLTQILPRILNHFKYILK